MNGVCCKAGQLNNIAIKNSISMIVNKRANEIHDQDDRLTYAGEMARDVMTSENYISAFEEIAEIFNISY